MLDEKHLARFFSKLKLNPDTGCMEWQCGTANGGYGCFSINRRPYRAHRVAAYLAGMIEHPKGIASGHGEQAINVLHRCDNPLCCNPEHLFLGKHQDNMDDMRKKGRGIRQISDETVVKLRDEYATGKISMASLAMKYGITWGHARDLAVGAYRRSAGGAIVDKILTVDTPKPDGQRKLTDAQVKDIRTWYAAGIYSQNELARMFGVSQRCVNQVVLGKRYVSV